MYLNQFAKFCWDDFCCLTICYICIFRNEKFVNLCLKITEQWNVFLDMECGICEECGNG